MNITKKRIGKLQDYLNENCSIDKWKQKIYDFTSLGDNTFVYLYYPELFWNAFNLDNHNSEYLDKLCIAGYLYFSSIIIQDDLMDSDNKRISEYLPLISYFQEETIKLLTQIYTNKSELWDKWYSYKERFVNSIHLDKNTNDSLSWSDYENFAINKSIFAQFAIDCCFFLTERNENDKAIYEKLIRSHNLFSISMQIIDDFDDLKEDFENEQKNIIIQNCIKLAKESGTDLNSIKKLKKFFYLSGYANSILKKCHNYLTSAKSEVKNIPGLDIWNTLIKDTQLKVFHYLSQIDIYMKEVYARSYFSHQKFQGQLTLEDRLEKAMEFIYKQQSNDGSWGDIITKQGVSSVWTTGFVLWNLSFKDFSDNENHVRAIEYLLANKSADLWGYNSSWIQDVDSTTNVLFALEQNNRKIEQELDNFYKLQKSNGAFSTYFADDHLKINLGHDFSDFPGWIKDHTCVSALVLYFLSITNGNKDVKVRLLNYLLNAQNKSGLWDSYWWTSPIYATSFIVKSLIHEGYSAYYSIINKAIGGMLALKNMNYSFGTMHNKESAFYTLLVLDTLCSSEHLYDQYKEVAQGIFNWVIENQLSDGSFNSSYILRVPAPHIINPDIIENWSIGKSEDGVNLVTEDFMRLFTTSFAVQVFAKYKNILSINNLSSIKNEL